jgi:RNA polymerase sigma factor (sigma-70 family)
MGMRSAQAVALRVPLPSGPSAPARSGLRPARPSGIISPRHAFHDTTAFPLSAEVASDGYRTSVSHEQIYQEHLELIEGVITLICRRNRLNATDADDFRQDAHVKLLESGALAKYEGRSSLRTYLTVVLQRMYLDFRTKAWGKWRPSVEAQRNGPVAILLERFVVRDGMTFEEAVETLRTNHGVTSSRDEIEALAGRLPMRTTRKPQGEEALAGVPASGPLPDAVLSREELDAHAQDVRKTLLQVLRELDTQDRLIVKLRFFDGLPIVAIARVLKVEPKPLYRRIEQILARLKRALEGKDIDPKDLFDDRDPWG